MLPWLFRRRDVLSLRKQTLRRVFLLFHLDVCPGGGGYSHISPIRVCDAQRGRDFEAPDLERGIHFTGVF